MTRESGEEREIERQNKRESERDRLGPKTRKKNQNSAGVK